MPMVSTTASRAGVTVQGKRFFLQGDAMTEETALTGRASREASIRDSKYLTFALAREEYGLELLKVREIVGYMDVTAVPWMPTHVKGVVNLRGQVIPVVDLRAKFGMEAADLTEQTCIIVVEITRSGRKCNVGIMVDRVSEVLAIAGADIEDPPQLGPSVDTDFILGMAKVGESVKILLDIDKVLDELIGSELPEDQERDMAAVNE
jgi:purine-binding chemotaxis protein CheW